MKIFVHIRSRAYGKNIINVDKIERHLPHHYRVCFYEVMSFILKTTTLIGTEVNLFLSAFDFIYIDNETIQDMDVQFN